MTDGVIGREDELSAVDAFLDRPFDRMRALVLDGPAGIGKSTIWHAGVAGARGRSFEVLVSRPAEAERTLPYVVLSDLFADVEPALMDRLEVPRRRAFESALLRAESELPVDPRALGVAILTLLSMLAQRAPVVVAIDDDQWIDASSAATLSFALRRLVNERILLLLSRRLDHVPAAALEDLVETAEAHRLRVPSLSVGAVQLLVRSRLDRPFPRPTLLRLHEASGGNPFYALELARARTMDPDRDPAAPIAVTPSLERLVVSRLDALTPLTRRALLLIAAHGRMSVGLLQALKVSHNALQPARAATMIETAGGVVSFTHPLLASAVYQDASAQDRRMTHRRLATALEDPVERGRHLALAAEARNGRLAADLESAAVVARERGMPLAAAELAEHALRLTPSERDGDMHRRAMAAARAHLDAGAGSHARAIAADVLARAAPGVQRAEALILGSEVEDIGQAVMLLEQALSEAVGAPALEARIHARLGVEGRAVKGRAWAGRHAHEALRLAEQLNDVPLRAETLMTIAFDHFEHGDPQGIEQVEQAHTLVTSLAHPHRVGWADTSMGWVLTISTEYGRSREWLENQLDYWRERDEQVRSGLLWLLALTEFWSGRWTLASEYAELVREISLQYEEVSTDHLSPALIALHRGQIAVARGHSERALMLAKGHLLPQHQAILGVCDLWSGDSAAAVAHLSEADHTADLRGWKEPNIRWWRADLCEALLQVGRAEEAAHLIGDWEAAAARVGRGRAVVHVVRCRGLVAAARGDVATAARLFEQAADRYEAIGDLFSRGRTFLALGTVRLRARQKRDARSAIEAAVATFDALGAQGWAATARAELARVGGRERIEGLSPSEHRVAELVAQGRTNREIATTLFLGERTVASHLTHIYAKLGVRSRTELARRMPATAQVSDEIASKVPTS
jgi:DNA-binding CsgD family transcriptional regulator